MMELLSKCTDIVGESTAGCARRLTHVANNVKDEIPGPYTRGVRIPRLSSAGCVRASAAQLVRHSCTEAWLPVSSSPKPLTNFGMNVFVSTRSSRLSTGNSFLQSLYYLCLSSPFKPLEVT
jgi:hypothetical protein